MHPTTSSASASLSSLSPKHTGHFADSSMCQHLLLMLAPMRFQIPAQKDTSSLLRPSTPQSKSSCFLGFDLLPLTFSSINSVENLEIQRSIKEEKSNNLLPHYLVTFVNILLYTFPIYSSTFLSVIYYVYTCTYVYTHIYTQCIFVKINLYSFLLKYIVNNFMYH